VLWADIDTIGTDTVRLRKVFTAYNPALNDTGIERPRQMPCASNVPVTVQKFTQARRPTA
jgi:hypothetical protein